ncbi:MAG: STAS-like domain-containing protein [candidate division WOR-3 bacterium]|nr:STAS-like domain-containing protein [candidate division WOR-3 bacterium]
MNKEIKILSIVGPDCITPEDGERIYKLIHPGLKKGLPVILDFEGVGVFASPFFNAAIGQLLKDIKLERLKELLKIINITKPGNDVLERVLENSARYYSDPELRKVVDKILKELFKEE